MYVCLRMYLCMYVFRITMEGGILRFEKKMKNNAPTGVSSKLVPKDVENRWKFPIILQGAVCKLTLYSDIPPHKFIHTHIN